MDRLFLNGFNTEESKSMLAESAIIPLLRELVFKFKLRVLRPTPMPGSWLMCHENGIAVGEASVTLENGVATYYYYSPFFVKQRGSCYRDKRTVKSTKLSTLVAALKKHGAIPTPESSVHLKVRSPIISCMELMRASIGRSSKTQELSVSTVHALLAHYFNTDPNSLGLSLPVDLCKNTFDKYNEADRVSVVKEQTVNEFFRDNPFYMIGIDGSYDFLVGKVKVPITPDARGNVTFEMVEPFKRCVDITASYPDLIPLMLMVKLAYENHTRRPQMFKGVPLMDEYNESLNCITYYSATPDAYEHLFMLTPC